MKVNEVPVGIYGFLCQSPNKIFIQKWNNVQKLLDNLEAAYVTYSS